VFRRHRGATTVPDSVRPGHYDPERPTRASVIVTFTVEVELVLLDAHPLHPRIDTVVRHGDNVHIIHGTPAATPRAARLPAEYTPIAEICVPQAVSHIWPGSITNLQPGTPGDHKTR
jgi:hypothetical protein